MRSTKQEQNINPSVEIAVDCDKEGKLDTSICILDGDKKQKVTELGVYSSGDIKVWVVRNKEDEKKSNIGRRVEFISDIDLGHYNFLGVKGKKGTIIKDLDSNCGKYDVEIDNFGMVRCTSLYFKFEDEMNELESKLLKLKEKVKKFIDELRVEYVYFIFGINQIIYKFDIVEHHDCLIINLELTTYKGDNIISKLYWCDIDFDDSVRDKINELIEGSFIKFRTARRENK